jgi:hypothetical protein
MKLKKNLYLITLILSIPLIGDERASSGKCYLFTDYVNDKTQIKEYLINQKYPLERYSVFRRNDGQYYFTLGKMKKKLFEELKSSGQADGLGCTRGKGFQKRYNINKDFELIAGIRTQKLIESKNEFYTVTNVSGITLAEIAEHELVTGYEFDTVYAYAQYFTNFKKLFIKSNIPYTNNKYIFLRNFSRDISGYSYSDKIQFVNSILLNYSDLLSIGIDILDKETAQSVIRSINSNKKIQFSSPDNTDETQIYEILQNYYVIATELNFSSEQMELLFKNFAKIIDVPLVQNYDLETIYTYYKNQLKIAESKNKTFDNHIMDVIKEQQKMNAIERQEYALKFPIKFIIKCIDGPRRLAPVSQCLSPSNGKDGEGGMRYRDSNIIEELGGKEMVYESIYARRQYTWEKDYPSASCSFMAQKAGSMQYWTFRLEKIDNFTGEVIEVQECSSPYCVIRSKCL